MHDILFAIISGLITSLIYDSAKKFFKQKPSKNDSHEYTKKYFRDVKLEFYISFPLGILLILASIWYPDAKQLLFTFAFFLFFVSLMAFMCLTEIVNNLTNDDPN